MKDIPVAYPYIDKEEIRAVSEVVRSGWVSMGNRVREFEDAFAKYVGSRHAIAVNNGTSAVHLALIANGISDGDEVLVPDITFISTANAVLYERAVPVLVECDPKTYNISLEQIEKRLTPKTKAVIVVDMNGMPVDYDLIMDFTKKYHLKVIADSAESVGAVYRGRKIGSIAPIHTFSFFANKNITTGEGGMITTFDTKKASLIRRLLNQGQNGRYNHVLLGYNYRMNDILAAFGLEQLKRIDFILAEKDKIAQRYNQAFKNDPDISVPFIPEYVNRHSWYMYAVSLRAGINRDKVVSKLKSYGIDTRLSFPPIHIQPYYRKRFGYRNNSLPVSLKAWQLLIDLPIWVGLRPKDQDFIIKTIKYIVRRFAQ